MKIYGKKNAVEALTRFKTSGRFPHALLFTGAKGIGRRTLADYCAMLYLCEKQSAVPCMNCGECTRTEKHIHPDVIYPINSMEKGKYNVKDLRKFITQCYRKPNDGEIRVCIFESLDEMSVQCQNALLKFIEEPLPFNRYIFTAEKRSAILETVLSRVTVVPCDEADKPDFTDALLNKGISAEKIEELYRLFGGNIGAAIDAENSKETIELYNRANEISSAIAEGREYDCGVLFKEIENRESLSLVLGILAEIFAGAAASKSGLTNKGALSEQSKAVSRKLSLKTVCGLYEECSSLYKKCEFNPNIQLFAARCCCSLFSVREKGI